MTVMQNLNVLENTHIKLETINKMPCHTNLRSVAEANFITAQLHNHTEKQKHKRKQKTHYDGIH